MAAPKVGDLAPAFSGATQDGSPISLANLKGQTVVLYFYPKDDTPGCTKEACGFRDVYSQIQAKKAVVIGVSPDGVADHAKFAKKFDLNFPLLADESRTCIEAYGAWGEKSMYGKTYMGVIRSTFVIGPDGKIKAVFPKVKPEEHAAEILALL